MVKPITIETVASGRITPGRVPAKVDRVGGVFSILMGLMCGYIGLGDKAVHHSIWRVWAFFCLLLVFNGVAMLWHARQTVMLEKA